MRPIPLLLLAAAFAAAERPATGLADLAGAEWTLASLHADAATASLPAAPRLTLAVDAGGAASGQSAVNRWFGSCSVAANGACRVSGIGATMMAGEPPLMDLELAYFQALQKVGRASLDGGALILSGDGVRLVFSRAAARAAGATASRPR